MDTLQIRHRLDLIIILIDTTTGLRISERNVRFYEDGVPIRFLNKGAGIYALLDSPRRTTTYEIKVKGYEPQMVTVEYSESVRKYPDYEVPLVPDITRYSYLNCLTLEGQLDGLEEICGIHLLHFDRSFQSYDPKKRVLTFFGGAKLMEREYAIYQEDMNRFGIFQVSKAVDRCSAVLRQPLEKGFKPRSPIIRVVRGKVLPDGHYVMRVQDDGEKVEYLVRYIVHGESHFQRINFRDEERKLEV